MRRRDADPPARRDRDRSQSNGTCPWPQGLVQFWDTQLTYEPSWLARLKYTNENAVHHGLVQNAENYRWCSAAWFASTARRGFVGTVKRMKVDRINVYDDFEPR